MHIEVFETDKGSGQWYWHFRNKGRVTADSEAFPSKNNAIRAAKAVVTAVIGGRISAATGNLGGPVFSKQEYDAKTKCFIIRWC